MNELKKNWRFALSLAILALVLLFWFSAYVVSSTVEGVVTGTQGQAGQGNYIVFVKTPSGSMESLTNHDTWLRFKFNSTDVQGSIQVGKPYTFKVLGHRNYFISEYRNIVGVQELQNKEG